jgi:hypothetical protein
VADSGAEQLSVTFLNGQVVESPTTLDQLVTVVCPNLTTERRQVYGAMTFRPHIAGDGGLRIPVRGDRALVAIDTDGDPWMVEWTPADQSVGNFPNTGLVGLDSRLDVLEAASAPLVTSLPGSPVDGQECYYLADATLGIVWHLRYRSASASSYKWEWVGGSRIYVVSGVANNDFTTTSYVATATNLTLPLAGDYEVEVQAWGYCNTASGSGFASYSVASQTAANDGWAAVLGINHSNAGSAQNIYAPINASVAGRQLNFQGRTTAGTTRIYQFRLFAQPIRVG